ncbi:calcium-binding protein [Roseibium alexandrii]|uniref:calcium-binding protein n=1 Tax=Roseibium alexandrii TaxID=388408 RepID=UPI0037507F62
MTIGTEALSENIFLLSEEEQTEVNSILDGFEVDENGNLVGSGSPSGGPSGDVIPGVEPEQVVYEVIVPGEDVGTLSDDSNEGIFIQGGGDREIDASSRTEDTTIIGGEGAEDVTTGTGNDQLILGGGNDNVRIRGGENRIQLGVGDDVADASGGSSAASEAQGGASTAASDESTPSYFDSDQYLRDNADVANAVANGGFSSAYEHFTNHGLGEGRSPNANFDNAYYLSQNADVAAAVESGVFASGLEHFILFGQFEGRQPSAEITIEKYLDANPDVEAAVSAGITDAFAHAFQFGGTEGRATSAQDFIDGGEGNDTIRGGLGDDTLVGGSGKDIIDGGADDDIMFGGVGEDTFVFEANSGVDRIVDFEAGVDKLDITALDTTAADLVTGVTSDADGNAVVTFSSGNTVTLIGVSADSVNDGFFSDNS